MSWNLDSKKELRVVLIFESLVRAVEADGETL